MKMNPREATFFRGRQFRSAALFCATAVFSNINGRLQSTPQEYRRHLRTQGATFVEEADWTPSDCFILIQNGQASKHISRFLLHGITGTDQ